MRGQTQLSLVWILRGWETVLELFPKNVSKTKQPPHVRGYQDSLGFWILDTWFRILRQWNLDSGFLELYFGFQTPGFQISQTKISWIPESGFLYLGWKHIRRVTWHYKQTATTLQIGIYIYSTINFSEFNVSTLYIFADQVLYRSHVLWHIRLRSFAVMFKCQFI